jgi:hypothetical protein
LPAFIYLSVDILLRINLLEKHRGNGKKQPDRLVVTGESGHNLMVQESRNNDLRFADSTTLPSPPCFTVGRGICLDKSTLIS